MIRYTLTDSPIGPLLLLSDGKALTGLYTDGHQRNCNKEWIRGNDDDLFLLTKQQLADYFSGARRQFDLPVRMQGTPFQKSVWQELQKIPYGTTISYQEHARRIGNPKACRAVGLANGRNPICIVVPCHRVIGSDGALTGYGGGLPRKKVLLTLESEAVKSQ